MDASPAIPPRIPSARAVGSVGLAWLGLSFLGILGLAVVFWFDPARVPIFPACAFHRLTGWNCPGCGATRGLHALLHGRLTEALHDNALLLAGLVLVPLRAVFWFRSRSSGVPFLPLWCLWPLLAVAVVFGVVRNLPAFAFLSPA